MDEINSREKLIRLMNLYKDLIFSICLKMTGDYFTAEDITQETFISAYQNMDGFDGKNEKAWVSRIASNKCIDYLRAAARRSIPTAEEEIPEVISSGEDPQNIFSDNEVLKGVVDACRSLPEPYNEVGYSYFVEGLTAKEISEQKKQNIKTVQTQIYRARGMIKKYVRKEELLNEGI